MLKQQNNFFWFKFNALSRLMLVHGFSRFLPLYIINEYPKSGGSWLGQMLAAALDLPFPRNRLPVLRSSIMHGHYIHPGFMKNVVVVWRDGRDVLVSQYYHSLFKNEGSNTRLVELTRTHLNFNNYHDIQANLPSFIDYTYNRQKHSGFSWADFVQVWKKRMDTVHVKYEDLRQNPVSELQRITLALSEIQLERTSAEDIASRYSFEKQSGRKAGQEDTSSFMRKGIIGDWKNHFTPEARKIFDKFAGDALIALGYEKDHAWANK